MSAPKPASYGKDEAAGYRMAGGYAVGHARRNYPPLPAAMVRRARATLVAGDRILHS